MKKKRFGFTLVEMLGVLIILTIIFVIMVYNISKIIKETKGTIDSATTAVIEDATADFLMEKTDVYPRSNNYTYCITLTQLIDNNNLTDQQISSLNDKDMTVKVNFENNENIYAITKVCEEQKPNVDFKLIGSNRLVYEVGNGGQYTENGALAKDKDGNIVNYSTVIYDASDNEVSYIDTTKIGVYTVKYTALIDSKNYTIERIVKIVDTTAPVLTVSPNNDTIPVASSTYNVYGGVTASDNSGEIPKITAKSNLSLGTPGTYTITYTATDSSGNKASAKRTVVITSGTLVAINFTNPIVQKEINSGAYVDGTVTATGSDGSDLTSNIVTVITKGAYVVDSIDTTKLGTYYITYSVTKDNVIYKETREVDIVDTTKPVITGVSDSSIDNTVLTYDVLSGISVSDNSGEELTIKTSGTLSLGIPGSYVVTYTATDSSGNTASASRTITITQAVWSFNYTGNSQSFTIPCNGSYKIELWGAQGGDFLTILGGRGGYVSGNISLTKSTAIYIYVGGNPGTSETGGYNGGESLSAGQSAYGRAGGGATDIRLSSGLWNDSNGLKNRIIVAGGGGGANYRNYADQACGYGQGAGGYGGGLTGGTGETTNHTNTSNCTYGWGVGTGGTQTLGGVYNNYSSTGTLNSSVTTGSFGSAEYSNGSQSGGGSGYYGGGASAHGGAGGGSSFVSGYSGCNAINSDGTASGQPNHFSGKIFTSISMIAGNTSMPNPSGGTEVGHTGNGYARITLLNSSI